MNSQGEEMEVDDDDDDEMPPLPGWYYHY